MPAWLGWRALLQIASWIGLGSMMSGTYTLNGVQVNQNDIKTSQWTWLDWIIAIGIAVLLVWLLVLIYKKWFK